jgi:D-alanyl-D-alanine carboxypeptidase
VRPADLVPLESVFSQDLVTIDNDDGSVNATAGAAARDMFQAARENGIGRYLITSAYRCVSYQEAFYQEALSEDPSYGDDPYNNPVRVLPGNCTEHTTGLAIDILSEAYRDADDGYADTAEGKWLAQNAHKFGFILRYPRNKQHLTGVIFEPWHYRYVGVEAATEIYELGLCLEEYVYMPL